MCKMFNNLILALSLTALASCSAAGYRATRVELGTTTFEGDRDKELGSLPSMAVGYSFQDDLPSGNLARGWVGDVALRVTDIDVDLGGGDLTGSRQELDFGTRFYPDTGSNVYQLFLGFGGTLARFDLEDGVGSADETLPGVYGVIGAEWALGRYLRVGIQYRHTSGLDADLGDNPEEQELDGGSLTASIGVSL